jgi:hypothetical protein
MKSVGLCTLSTAVPVFQELQVNQSAQLVFSTACRRMLLKEPANNDVPRIGWGCH